MNKLGIRRAAATTIVALLVGVLAVPVFADHIPDTGPIPANCVEFQSNTGGSKSPSSFPGVTITVDSWDTPQDPHAVTFTIGGLAAGQYVDASVKSGQNVQEFGPYGNGTHTIATGIQQAISHIRLCVFTQPGETTTTQPGETTTTQPGETTTTQPEETTTTQPEETTTTQPGETTTTQPEETTTTVPEQTTTTEPEVGAETTTTVPEQTTTTEPEVGAETTTTQPEATTTTEPEVGAETTVTTPDDTLPFTGVDSDRLALMSLLAMGTGSALVALTRRSGDTRGRYLEQ